jgi:hypothetical protein
MKLLIPRDDLTSVLRQTLSACSPTAGEVNQIKLFTSLAVIALSLGEREEGQSLASEIVALALLVFAFFGALFLFKTVT